MSAGAAARQIGEQAKVRCCNACGADDLLAVLGVAVEFGETRRCPHCGATSWVLARQLGNRRVFVAMHRESSR